MPITKDINKTRNLTTFKISEKVTFDEFKEVIVDFYKEESTGYVIFDLRDAGGTGETFSHQRITELADFIESIRKGRDKGKTALVVAKDVLYGICKMIEAYMHRSEIKYATFRDMEKAVEWLEQDS
jgi:hypothetical protein